MSIVQSYLGKIIETHKNTNDGGDVLLGRELLLLRVRPLAQLLPILLVLPVRALQLEHLQDAGSCMQSCVVVAPSLDLRRKLNYICGFGGFFTWSRKGTPLSPPCFLGVNSVEMQWTLTKTPVSRVGSQRKLTELRVAGSCFTSAIP